MQHQYQSAWKRIEAHLQHALPEIRDLMAARFVEVGTPAPDSSLDQAGLQDGAEIVKEFLLAGEWAEAFDHLCYMIEEADLAISAATYASLCAAGSEMGYDVARWQGKVKTLPDPGYLHNRQNPE